MRTSGDFTVVSAVGGNYQLQFNRDVRTAVVVATHHRPFCDGYGGNRPIQIGKRAAQADLVCVFFADGGFSFVLIDDGEVENELKDTAISP